MADLVLPVKAVYFDAVRDGTKLEEYRLRNDYWAKRLEGRSYDNVILTKGYPKKDDLSRRITVPWRGFRKITLTHEHFGRDPVNVYAIRVSDKEPI